MYLVNSRKRKRSPQHESRFAAAQPPSVFMLSMKSGGRDRPMSASLKLTLTMDGFDAALDTGTSKTQRWLHRRRHGASRNRMAVANKLRPGR
ncbi:hypothetical protein E4U54_008153 [Claviceps lovelessii]|nr:hypothetical protein E4U54_008153 [Claviceps lovelessii]